MELTKKELREKDILYLTTMSKELCYILGFVNADGYVSVDKGHIQITLQARDVEILEFIKSKVPTITGKILTRVNKGKFYKRLLIYSVEVVKYFVSLGLIQRKGGHEYISDKIEYLDWYCRGEFDGDGHIAVSKTGIITYSILSLSKKYIEQFRDLLGYGSIKKRLTAKGNPYYVWITGEAREAVKFGEFIYKDRDGFCLKRKRVKFDNFNIHDHPIWYSQEELDFIKDNVGKLSHKKIGEILHRPANGIKIISSRCNFLSQPKTQWDAVDLNMLMKLSQLDIPQKQISIFLNRTESSISHKIQRLRKQGHAI